MALPWLRLYHEFGTDPVTQTMSEALQRRLIMVFCFMQSGDLDKLDEQELAEAMGLSPEELAFTKQAFIKKGLIGKNWHPINWKKRQCFDHGAAERMRNMRRNKSVTKDEQKTNPRANSVCVSVSESSEGGSRGADPKAISNICLNAEKRWPSEQNLNAFVDDLCSRYDPRLVEQILNQAFDKEPGQPLPRGWIRAGCENEFNRGWKPGEVHKRNGPAEWSPYGPAKKSIKVKDLSPEDRAKAERASARNFGVILDEETYDSDPEGI